jgi:N-acyl-D-amino-acid deacylase
VLIPGWALARRGGASTDKVAALRAVMSDPAANAKLRQDITHEIRRRGGAAKVLVFDHPVADFAGKSLAEIAKMRGLSEVDAAIALQLEGDPARAGGGRVRGFSLSELDIEMYAARNWVATATDGGIALPEDGPATHARFYGTFPRKIRRYALERGALTLEDAIRSATSLPARILGLEDRGMVRAGFVADLAVFDVNRIRDTATSSSPTSTPRASTTSSSPASPSSRTAGRPAPCPARCWRLRRGRALEVEGEGGTGASQRGRPPSPLRPEKPVRVGWTFTALLQA